MSKNQEWKKSRSELPFKEWLRHNLNKDVQQTIAAAGYKNVSGDLPPACNYKPCLTNNTVLGVNKWLIYSATAVALGAIVYGIVWKHKKGRK